MKNLREAREKRIVCVPLSADSSNEEEMCSFSQRTLASAALISSTGRSTAHANQPSITKKPNRKRKNNDSSEDKDAPSTKFKFILDSKCLDDANLKAESNNKYYNKGQRMCNLFFLLCKRKFIKSNRGVTNKSIAVFNAK